MTQVGCVLDARAKLAERPLSGGIFALEVDVPGVPVARFEG